MSLNNWYPFYVGDYMRDTAQLSMVEHGAYRLLLDHYYSTGEPLPDDEKQLFRICRAFDEQEQDAIKRVLQLFFKHDAKAQSYTQSKVQKEIQKKADISDKRAQAAKNKGKNGRANAKQLQSKCKAIADTSTSTSTSTYNNPPIIPQNDFDEFWKEWKPYDIAKGNKQTALKSYTNARKETDHETIIRGMREYIKYCHESGTRTKHASTWLNQSGWLDEYNYTKANNDRKPSYTDTLGNASRNAQIRRMAEDGKGDDEGDYIPFNV